ncbi:MAG TPA: LapA family protein [Gaiellaceae bacterium]|nr:LapA family protein [Gaiellaceae bacterium]
MSSPGGSGAPERDTPWKLIIFGAIAVYAILIVLFNRKQVDVSFVFFSAQISLLVLILLCVGIGFAAGYLFEQLRTRRKRSATSAQ